MSAKSILSLNFKNFYVLNVGPIANDKLRIWLAIINVMALLHAVHKAFV